MRLIISYILVILTIVCANAQTVQLGVVKEYNEKEQKTPLAGVELNIISAQSTTSDTDGKFELSFLTLNPGDKITYRKIEKLGYEIFNKEALEQWNLNPNAPFTIVMCKSDKFKRIRDNYERQASANYDKQYKKEIHQLKTLKESGKIKDEEYRKQLVEIQENYDRQLDNLDNYVDRFARIDLSELKVGEQKIIELVEEGRFEEAINKYDQLNIESNLIQGLQKSHLVTEAITKLEITQNSLKSSNDSLFSMADRYISVLLLAGGRENLNKIRSIYQKIADVDTTNIKWLLNTGSFIYEYFGDDRTSMHYYTKALRSIKKDSVDDLLNNIIIYNCIGKIKLESGDGITAFECFKKSVEYADLISSENVSDNLITSLNNISSVFSLYGAYDRASFFNQKSLNLALSRYPDDNLLIADIYNNAAVISAGKSDYKQAFDQIDKAISIKEHLVGENSPSTITSIWNKGLIYKDQLDYDSALIYLNNALVISKMTYPDNYPKLYKIYKDFTSLDVLLDFWDNNERQITIFEEFVDIQNKISDDSLRIADSYEKLTKLCLNNKHYQKAIDYVEIWYSIIRNSDDEEKTFEKYYYHILSKIYELTGDAEKSLVNQNKIIEINKVLYGLNDMNTLQSFMDMGTKYVSQGNYTEAIYYYNTALGIQTSLTGAYSKETASLLCILGYTYKDNKEFKKALDCFNKALSIYESYLDEPGIKLTHIYTSSTIDSLKKMLTTQNSD